MCKRCGLEHRPMDSCRKAAYQASLVANEPVMVANADPLVANSVVANDVVVANSKHGRYADKQKRLEYMRELMREKRLKEKEDGS